MPTSASLFSGGKFADVGLVAAGFDPLWGVELDPAIAEVADANLPGVTIRARVEDVDYRRLAPPDLLWASPECKEFSAAKTNGLEGPAQRAQADAICGALEALRPPLFVLENVVGYRRSPYSLPRICAALDALGYLYTLTNVNCADYGGFEPCPIHDTNYLAGAVRNAGSNSPRGIAPDIVRDAALMPPVDQARILAWDVLALLVKTTAPGTAVNATWPELGNVGSGARLTPSGRAGDASTIAAMSEYASMERIAASIESWLNRSSDDHSLLARWSITETKTRQITTQLISRSIRATAPTPPTTTRSDAIGVCPLCRYWAIPQTRRRLILRAARSLLPPLRGRERWVGWYAAIADLLPTLPESALAPWQLARLAPLFGDTLVHPTADNPRFPVRDGAAPAFTTTATDNPTRGFLLDGNSSGQEWGKLYRADAEPAFTTKIITRPDSHMPRAFLIGGGNTELANPTSRPRDGADPAFTVAGNDSATTNQRAWPVSGQSVEGGAPATRDGSEPSLTVGTNGDRSRAFIVDDQHGGQLRGEDGRGLTNRQAADPVFTVQAGSNKPARAWLEQGRVVAMTPRALARFQSIPDSYALPESRGLACRIIGNGVPPLLAQRVAESLLGLLP